MRPIKNLFLYTFDFVGVTNRQEFWVSMIFVFGVMAAAFGLSFLGSLFQLVLIFMTLILALPTLAIMARRLHDTDRSAYNLLWLLLVS